MGKERTEKSQIEYVVDAIRRLKKIWYPKYEDNKHTPGYLIEWRSYSRFAMEEMVQYIRERPDQNAIVSLEDFRYQSDCRACESNSELKTYMYAIFYDVATDVIDELNRR